MDTLEILSTIENDIKEKENEVKRLEEEVLAKQKALEYLKELFKVEPEKKPEKKIEININKSDCPVPGFYRVTYLGDYDKKVLQLGSRTFLLSKDAIYGYVQKYKGKSFSINEILKTLEINSFFKTSEKPLSKKSLVGRMLRILAYEGKIYRNSPDICTGVKGIRYYMP